MLPTVFPQRATLQRPVGGTRDKYNVPGQTFTAYAQGVACRARQNQAGQQATPAGRTAVATYTIAFAAYRDDLRPGHRVLIDGQTYRVQSVDNGMLALRRVLNVTATLVGQPAEVRS